ncbi:hypothetical protein [Nitrospira moscoviensis]|uniref:Uncharacterized protein n=1 Tax=Nitrospira moscoviensis TaxID=42253 RepID=A0A0K2GDP1_NITMO|nr:hypothetical protein [Nitrospira moscoviensis]ALA59075.1 hypothetical protein NITMOv2_2662 [Nitrospira moscoviensis]
MDGHPPIQRRLTAPRMRALAGFALTTWTLSVAPPVGPDEPTEGTRLPYSVSAETVKADAGVYPVRFIDPPSKGGTIIDPAFGIPILRLTDESDGSQCRNLYSYWASMNLDHTKILVYCDHKPYILDFDPRTLTVRGPKYPALPAGVETQGEILWSSVHADLIFYQVGRVLHRRDVATGQGGMETDFSAVLAPHQIAWQLSKSDDDDVFAFTKAAGYCRYEGYAVWSRSQRRFLANEDLQPMDEVHIDKTGRYLAIDAILSVCAGGADPPVHDSLQWIILDLVTGTRTPLYDNPSDLPPGHYALGRESMVGSGWAASPLQWRSLATASSTLRRPRILYDFGGVRSGAHHSALADNEHWVLTSSYSGTAASASRPFENEIYQTATDGSGRMRRLVHHRSHNNDGFWDTPRANISKNGRFVVFTSNWNGLRRDAYMAIIPPAP